MGWSGAGEQCHAVKPSLQSTSCAETGMLPSTCINSECFRVKESRRGSLLLLIPMCNPLGSPLRPRSHTGSRSCSRDTKEGDLAALLLSLRSGDCSKLMWQHSPGTNTFTFRFHVYYSFFTTTARFDRTALRKDAADSTSFGIT